MSYKQFCKYLKNLWSPKRIIKLQVDIFLNIAKIILLKIKSALSNCRLLSDQPYNCKTYLF